MLNKAPVLDKNAPFIIIEANLGMKFLTVSEAYRWAHQRSRSLGAPPVKYYDVRDAITFGDKMPEKNLKGYKRLHLSGMKFICEPC